MLRPPHDELSRNENEDAERWERAS